MHKTEVDILKLIRVVKNNWILLVLEEILFSSLKLYEIIKFIIFKCKMCFLLFDTIQY